MRGNAAHRRLVVLGAGALAVGVLLAPSPAGAVAKTSQANVSSSGTAGNAPAYYPGISGTGRRTVFESSASNLVPGTANGQTHVYVHDRRTDKTNRASRSAGGAQGNGDSGYAAISGNGRFVVFWSEATNLVRGDTNGKADVFIHDLRTRRTGIVSRSWKGKQGNANSAYAAISANGRFVAFTSDATNLVPGDTNGFTDIFVRDRERKTTRRVTLSSSGAQADASTNNMVAGGISDDGRFVLFDSPATNLVPDDTNAAYDIFLRDMKRKITRRLSVGPNGVQGDASSRGTAMSPDARFVVFGSQATNLVAGDSNGNADIFIRDRARKITRRVNVGPAGAEADFSSDSPMVSANGRFVSFGSRATNLVSGDTNGYEDIFVRDRRTKTTRRVSVGPGGAQGNDFSMLPLMSSDGRFVVFQSVATNLIANDLNGHGDIFFRGPLR